MGLSKLLTETPATDSKMEAASGFEPLNGSFADCSLSHLGTPPVSLKIIR